MNIFFDVKIPILIISAGIFSIIISFTQLIMGKRRSVGYLSFLMYLLYGCCVLCDTRYRIGTEALTPHLLYINYPLAFCLGPVCFFFFRELVCSKAPFSWKNFLLFTPGLLAFLFLFPFFFSTAQTKLDLFPLVESLNPFVRVGIGVLDYFLIPWIIFCFLLSLKYTYFLWNKRTIVQILYIRKVSIVLVLEIIFSIVLFYANVRGNYILYQLSLFTLNIITFYLFFISIKYPDFFFELRKETLQITGERSTYIGNLNTSLILKQIECSINQDMIYKDYELTIKKFSDKLGISTHQMSEIINKNYKMNFRQFINGHRLDAVKKILLERTDLTIIEIAFSCGFNFKTTFNTSFTKNEGLSPSKFRKNNL